MNNKVQLHDWDAAEHLRDEEDIAFSSKPRWKRLPMTRPSSHPYWVSWREHETSQILHALRGSLAKRSTRCCVEKETQPWATSASWPDRLGSV